MIVIQYRYLCDFCENHAIRQETYEDIRMEINIRRLPKGWSTIKSGLMCPNHEVNVFLVTEKTVINNPD